MVCVCVCKTIFQGHFLLPVRKATEKSTHGKCFSFYLYVIFHYVFSCPVGTCAWIQVPWGPEMLDPFGSRVTDSWAAQHACACWKPGSLGRASAAFHWAISPVTGPVSTGWVRALAAPIHDCWLMGPFESRLLQLRELMIAKSHVTPGRHGSSHLRLSHPCYFIVLSVPWTCRDGVGGE